MPIRTIVLALTSFAAIGAAFLAPAVAAQGEAPRVISEACGDEPAPECVAKLKKACRGKVTFRCYYARKRQLDGPGLDSPEKSDERDDRSIFYDE